MKWSEEAGEEISRVPFFVRKRVRKRVEEEAVECGNEVVGIEHVRACQRRFLRRMEDEVKGFQMETCFSPGGCPNRAVEGEGIARDVEERLSKRDLKSFLRERLEGPLKMHHEFRVSVADCPNACSRPQIVDVGLIGACVPSLTGEACSLCGTCMEACREDAVSLQENGPAIDYSRCLFCGKCALNCPTGRITRGAGGYRILIGGKLGRHPRLARELPGIFSENEVLETIEKCLDHYQRHCRRGERLGEILARTGGKGLEPRENDKNRVP